MSRTIDITIENEMIGFSPGTVHVSLSTVSSPNAEFTVRQTRSMPRVGDTVGVFDYGRRIFGGDIESIVLDPIVTVSGSEAWYRCTATGWQRRLERRLIPAAAYSEMSFVEVVVAIIQDWAPGEVLIGSITPALNKDEMGTVIIRGTTVYTALQDLCERANLVLSIDPDRELTCRTRTAINSPIEVISENKNYRDPQVVISRTDYFNRCSIAIAYDAFQPLALSLNGDAAYPFFLVYDPADPEKKPLAIDVLQSIKLNGVEQTIAVKASGTATLYYTPGSPLIEWDPTAAQPGPTDVITTEFYPIGSNVITVDAGPEIAARAAIEELGSGVYHAYLEDFDCHDVVIGTKKANEFIALHAPAVSIADRAAGDLPTEYRWTMYSHELFDNGSIFVQELLPGRLIRFKPSTPHQEDRYVLIQSVDIEDVYGHALEGGHEEGTAGIFRYSVVGIDATKQTDYVSFYKALAETGESGQMKDFTISPGDRIGADFVFPGAVTTGIIQHYALVSSKVPLDKMFRCIDAQCVIYDPAVGANILVDMRYSNDGGATWNNVFASTAGDLVMAAGAVVGAKLGVFSGFPVPLDIYPGAIIRAEIIQVGSTTAGSGLTATLVGEIRTPPIA